MNLYHCMIDLHSDAKALAFARACGDWMDHLRERGLINDWRLLRRKLNLASDAHGDFLLEIEVERFDQLDQVFRYVSSASDTVEALYSQVHPMIQNVQYGLYRPFPDPERAERVGLL